MDASGSDDKNTTAAVISSTSVARTSIAGGARSACTSGSEAGTERARVASSGDGRSDNISSSTDAALDNNLRNLTIAEGGLEDGTTEKIRAARFFHCKDNKNPATVGCNKKSVHLSKITNAESDLEDGATESSLRFFRLKTDKSPARCSFQMVRTFKANWTHHLRLLTFFLQ